MWRKDHSWSIRVWTKVAVVTTIINNFDILHTDIHDGQWGNEFGNGNHQINWNMLDLCWIFASCERAGSRSQAELVNSCNPIHTLKGVLAITSSPPGSRGASAVLSKVNNPPEFTLKVLRRIFISIWFLQAGIILRFMSVDIESNFLTSHGKG